ncbi:MAG: PFL family protein, partial [Schwartzia sp.]|nr:PFL family protein [Schwartzia sp. (in: firmicutes)]
MITVDDILETNRMITENKLDVRTITMGISLRGCAHPNMKQFCDNIYDRITTAAEFLVKTGEDIEAEYGIPIIHKRVSVTPIAIAAEACKTDSYVPVAETLDRAAKEVGINFIGGFSALVEKGFTHGDRILLQSIPQALASTELVCSSVNLASTKAGINMDCVREMGEIIKRTAELTRDRQAIGCAKLVVFANAPGDNPFMAGAFHGVSEAETVVSVGVSGPGVVKHALEDLKGADFTEIAETVKRTAFKITRVGQLVAREASKRLGGPFGIIDLSLAPTPAVGDSVANVLEEMGLESCGAPGTTAALALLN